MKQMFLHFHHVTLSMCSTCGGGQPEDNSSASCIHNVRLVYTRRQKTGQSIQRPDRTGPSKHPSDQHSKYYKTNIAFIKSHRVRAWYLISTPSTNTIDQVLHTAGTVLDTTGPVLDIIDPVLDTVSPVQQDQC